MKTFKHKGNGKYYLQIEDADLVDFTIKQSSDNKEWESPVFYMELKDPASEEKSKMYITGAKRFSERFEVINVRSSD